MLRGFTPPAASLTACSPAARAATLFVPSVAGMLPLPRAAMPSASHTMAIVFAVNWPPHAPAPGHATSSSVWKSASLMWPEAWAPTASNTSWMVTRLPWKMPGAIDPP